MKAKNTNGLYKLKATIKNIILAISLLISVFLGSIFQDAQAVVLDPITINSLEDVEDPPEGMITLRSALQKAVSGQPIVFDPSFDGAIIELSIIGEEHTILKGEVMGMREEPSGPVSYLVGYFDRDYGKSALYARKNVVIDASSLPSGITIIWTGGEENPARVLTVYGNLYMNNISIAGGWSVAEKLQPPDPDDEYGQLSTRARGGGLAVWGVAHLVNCRLYNNHCKREIDVPARSRDAGVFGGGIYADIVDMEKVVVSGNSVSASGVSGGGVFSVGGAEALQTASTIRQSAITGNRIQGFMAYGGGVYSDGGGIGNRKKLELTNCTIARNLIEILHGLPSFMYRIGYWRGSGVYMSNGYMSIHGCTIVENKTQGVPRTDDLGKPNLAGGVAATIGNAHAVEEMLINHSIIAGNMVYELGLDDIGGDPVNSYGQDIFTGSLLHFKSRGYNRFGVIDFSQILVPVGERDWESLSRKHYPKNGDVDGVNVADLLNLTSGLTYSDSILSAGVDIGSPVVLHYEPQGSALDQIPASPYIVNEIYAEYTISEWGTNNFLQILLDRVEDHYELTDFASDFTANFEAYLQSVDTDDETTGDQPYTDFWGNPILTIADTKWFGPVVTWPKELPNYPYIEFWHRFDDALRNKNIVGMGPELIGDDAWSTLFVSGPLDENGDISMILKTRYSNIVPIGVDQLGALRPANFFGDIGAIEKDGFVGGATITSSNATIYNITYPGAPEGVPAGFILGTLIGFTATDFPGRTADISITWTSFPPNSLIYKVINGTWKQIYPTNQTTGITNVALIGNTLSFTIEDGSDCDADGLVNDSIQDPVATGSRSAPAAGSNSSGCFIDTVVR